MVILTAAAAAAASLAEAVLPLMYSQQNPTAVGYVDKVKEAAEGAQQGQPGETDSSEGMSVCFVGYVVCGCAVDLWPLHASIGSKQMRIEASWSGQYAE